MVQNFGKLPGTVGRLTAKPTIRHVLPLKITVAAAFIVGIYIRYIQIWQPLHPNETCVMNAVLGKGLSAGRPWYIHFVSPPPLFSVLLKLWSQLFGTSAAATAWLSLSLMLVGVFILYRLAVTLFDRLTALTVAALFWSSYLGIYYSTETGPYLLAMLLATGTTLVLYRYVQFHRSRALYGYGAMALFGIYAFPSFPILLFAQVTAICLFFRRCPLPKAAWLRWWYLQAVLAAASVPWLMYATQIVITMFRSGQSGQSVWNAPFASITSAQFPASVLHGFVYPTWVASWGTNLRVGILMILLALPLIGSFTRQGRWVIIRYVAPSQSLRYLMTVTVIPLLLLTLFDVGVPRYYVIIGPIFLVIFSAALIEGARQLHSVLLVAAFLALIFCLNLYYAVWAGPARVSPVASVCAHERSSAKSIVAMRITPEAFGS